MAMKQQGSSVGIIVSDFVHHAAVPHGEDAPDHVPVQARVKETSIPARMLIITEHRDDRHHPARITRGRTPGTAWARQQAAQPLH